MSGSLAALLLRAALLAAAPPAPFTEEAASRGIDFVHFNGMSGELYFVENMGSGAGLIDYDGDGDLDAYLVQGAMLGPGKRIEDATFPPRHPLPLSDRLYRNDSTLAADGTIVVRFVDVTERSGLAALTTGYGMGVAAGDYDGDGWLDLYLTSYGSNQLLHNEGDGTFSDATAASGTDDRRWSVSSSFFDYDGDGWLDLYVVNYVDFSFAHHGECRDRAGALDYCGPSAYEPVGDSLFRNLGDGTFEDVTATAGILSARGSGLGVVAADFDRDGRTDVYVANDQMPNFLWRNRGDGTFIEDGLLAGCAVNREGKAEASMGVLAEDGDGDGDDDLFMTHLAEETNTFFLNDGHGLFRDWTIQTGLGAPSRGFTGFGTGFLDLENDGELDLLVGNGAVTRIDELEVAGDPYPMHQPNQLFRNLGGLRFEEVGSESAAIGALSEVTRGIALGDVDGDGDLDALLANNAGPARLLVNGGGGRGHWIGARLLVGRRDAFGARVRVRSGSPPERWRRVHADGSYASAGDPRVLVGLGASDRVDEILIQWPGGGETRVTGLPADRYLVLQRPGPGAR
jgi:hypothetical protein